MRGTKGWRGLIVLVAILATSGCGGIKKKMDMEKTVLTPEGARVAISTAAPSSDCKSAGMVSYSFFKGTFFSCDFTDAENAMKNQAAGKGANYVKLLAITDAGVRCQGSGEAFSCPAPK